MYATQGQDVMSFAGVMEPAGRDSAPVTKPGGVRTSHGSQNCLVYIFNQHNYS